MSDEVKLERKNRRKVVARDINLQESELEKQKQDKEAEQKQNKDNNDLLDQKVKLRKVSDEQDQHEELIKEDMQDSEAVWNINKNNEVKNTNLDIDQNRKRKGMDFKIEGKADEDSGVTGNYGRGGGFRGSQGGGGFRGGQGDRGGFRGGSRGGFGGDYNRRREDDTDNDFRRGDLAGGRDEDDRKGWNKRNDRDTNDFRREGGFNNRRREDSTDNDFKRGDLINTEDDRDKDRERRVFRGGRGSTGSAWGDRGDRVGRDADRDRKESGGWGKNDNDDNSRTVPRRSFVNRKLNEDNDNDFRRGDLLDRDNRDNRNRDNRDNRDLRDKPRREEVDKEEVKIVKQGDLVSRKDDKTELRNVVKEENFASKVFKAPWGKK